MTWQEAIATVFICLGLAAGAFVFARRPAFWIEFGTRIFAKLLPVVWRFVSKRMDPDTERRWRECERRGGKWDYVRKRCLDR